MASVTKKLEKKMKIIDTAFSLFRDHSVSATAVDDIVKAAGIARGTFYLYFKDKSDLLEQIILYKSTEYMKKVLQDTLNSLMLKKTDHIESIRIFLNCFIDFLIENKEMLPIMSKNISSCIKHLPEFFDKDIADIYRNVIDLMCQYGYTEKTAHMTAFIIIDMTDSVCCDAILHNKPFPIEEIRDTVIESAISIIKNNASLTRGDQSETLC